MRWDFLKMSLCSSHNYELYWTNGRKAASYSSLHTSGKQYVHENHILFGISKLTCRNPLLGSVYDVISHAIGIWQAARWFLERPLAYGVCCSFIICTLNRFLTPPCISLSVCFLHTINHKMFVFTPAIFILI